MPSLFAQSIKVPKFSITLALNTYSKAAHDLYNACAISIDIITVTLSSGVSEQHMRRPACPSVQSDQRFVIGLLESIVSKRASSKLLIF